MYNHLDEKKSLFFLEWQMWYAGKNLYVDKASFCIHVFCNGFRASVFVSM